MLDWRRATRVLKIIHPAVANSAPKIDDPGCRAT
jgi:hypothetical protein